MIKGLAKKSRLDVCVHSSILTQKGTSVLCVYACVKFNNLILKLLWESRVKRNQQKAEAGQGSLYRFSNEDSVVLA